MVIKPLEGDSTPGTVKPVPVSLVEPVAYHIQLLYFSPCFSWEPLLLCSRPSNPPRSSIHRPRADGLHHQDRQEVKILVGPTRRPAHDPLESMMDLYHER